MLRLLYSVQKILIKDLFRSLPSSTGFNIELKVSRFELEMLQSHIVQTLYPPENSVRSYNYHPQYPITQALERAYLMPDRNRFIDAVLNVALDHTVEASAYHNDEQNSRLPPFHIL